MDDSTKSTEHFELSCTQTDRQTERQTNKHRSKSITYNEMDWEKITQNIKYKQTKKENVKSSGKLQPNLVGFTIICFL